MRTGRKAQGFTLIELLIVISIIAVLAGVAIPPLMRARKSSTESAAMQVLRSLRGAEEMHKTRHKAYGDLSALSSMGGSPVAEGGVDPTSGYRFTSSVGQDAYTIVAIPPTMDLSTYTLNETGTVEE